MKVDIKREPNPEPPVTGVTIHLTKDEAQLLYEIANSSGPVSGLVADHLNSSHGPAMQNLLLTIWSHMACNGFNCRRGR